MGTVLLGLAGHQTNIANISHCSNIKLSVRLDVINDLLVQSCVASIRNNALAVLQFPIFVPHHSRISNDYGHGCINNNVVGSVQIGDSLVGVDHGEPRTVFRPVRSLEIQLDFFLFLLIFDLVFNGFQNASETLFGIGANLFQNITVLGKDILEKDLDAVTKHDRVRDLHHGGLEVDTEENVRVLSVLNFVFQEVRQRRGAHARSINDLACLEGNVLLEDSRSSPVLGVEFDLDAGGLVANDGRLFRSVKVTL
mmetsp:Transcript_32520/g.76587  ORF Transcript_32520/g.76587 Transcript_32520/m.76587 type:complete len:253 (-) Transcript_32520:152-910(-)